MFGLLAQGISNFEKIDLYRGNDLFGQSLGLSFVPAQEMLRLYRCLHSGQYGFT